MSVSEEGEALNVKGGTNVELEEAPDGTDGTRGSGGYKYKTLKKSCTEKQNLFVFIPIVISLVLVIMVNIMLTTTTTTTSHQEHQSESLQQISQVPDNLNYLCVPKEYEKESWCIYVTPESFIKTVPDDLNYLCVPKEYEKGYVVKMFQCPDTQLYMPFYCMCDSKDQCKGGKQVEPYKKHNCTMCRDANRCPCQNNGSCNECPTAVSTGEDITCSCKPGTNGKYCTKITKRLCHQSDKIDDLQDCKSSNDEKCFIKNPNLNETFICSWKDLSAKYYSTCFEEKRRLPLPATSDTAKASAQTSDGEETNLKTIKVLLWIVTVSLLVPIGYFFYLLYKYIMFA